MTLASLGCVHVLASAAATADAATSLFEAFFIQRHADTGGIEWLGTIIIWALLLLSAVSLGLIAATWLDTKREKILPQDTLDQTLAAFAQRDGGAAQRAIEGDTSFFARLVDAALREASRGAGAMRHAIEQTSEQLTVARLRRVEPLSVIGNVAPMIGLFGTVYGMILAFREIVTAGGSPDPVGLAAGIGTALTTTFWGLVVAIPSLAGYALLRNRVDALTLDATREAEALVKLLSEGEAAGDSSPASSTPRGSATSAKPEHAGPKPAKLADAGEARPAAATRGGSA